MSKLEQLIKELCPDGVEYVKIKDVIVSLKTGLNPRKNFLLNTEDAENYYITVREIGNRNIVIHEKTDKVNDEALKLINNRSNLEVNDILFSGTGTIGRVSLVEKQPTNWNIKEGVYVIKPKDNLISSVYFMYILQSNDFIKSYQNKVVGSPVCSLPMADLKELKIPLPPLPVQEEIVKILDTFTELTVELTVELTAELSARKKQYEYYRDSILENNDYPYKPLGELCKFVRGPFGGALKKECFQNVGFAVYEQQHAIYSKFDFRYFISDEKFQELKRFEIAPYDLIMSCSGTMGKIAIIPPDAPRGIINQALLKLTAKENVDVKYLKYCFESTIAKQMNDNARGGAIKNVASVDVLKKIEVKLPPLEEQKRIVEILDRFDTLVNDIKEGLPTEIKARKKQYEYYRDKLLTFKRLEVVE